MTDAQQPMRLPRRPARVPGFVAPQETNAVPPAEPTSPDWSTAGSRQVNLRLRIPLHQRYRRLLRELDAEDFSTSLSEIVHALLDQGPPDTSAAKDVVRQWRRKVAG